MSCKPPAADANNSEGLLQKKFGLAKDEVKRQVDEFEASCGC